MMQIQVLFSSRTYMMKFVYKNIYEVSHVLNYTSIPNTEYPAFFLMHFRYSWDWTFIMLHVHGGEKEMKRIEISGKTDTLWCGELDSDYNVW